MAACKTFGDFVQGLITTPSVLDNFVYFDKKIFSEFVRMPGQYFES